MKKYISLAFASLLIVIFSGYFVISQNKTNSSKNISNIIQSRPSLESIFTVTIPNGYEKIVEVLETPVNKQYVLSIRNTNNQDETIRGDGVCVHCTLTVEVMRDFIGGKDTGRFQTPEEWAANQKGLGNGLVNTSLAGKVAYKTNFKKDQATYFIFSQHNDLYDLYSVTTKENDETAHKILSSLTFNF